ncbi:MAG TPA: hypothetical protein DCL61_12860 [Cyanobacteria bacterium UBA12227]|nr:hypothetical protein [Cyanobacteria bacterium UBA12227]HAX89520.1 hypothetical protein [Cyanobacteria bacterium UBA11370]HBY81757.1 hypothetical protein [Cyanobacteria bacterium UBA11148]
MKTLLTLFSKERGELQAEIEQAANPEQVVKLVQTRLDTLQRNYSGELSVAQVRLASFFLDILRQSINTLTATNETRVLDPKPQQISNSVTKFPANNIILKVLQGLIGVSILGSLFSLTQETPGAWMGILLMLVLGGLEVVLQLDKEKLENHLDVTQPVAVSQAIVQIDSKILLDHLADALNTIDLAVSGAEQVKKPLDSSRLEELPELLNVIQRLMGASFLEKPQMALELTKLLPQILIDQGIRVQIYQPDDKNSGREYFDFEPNIDHSATDYVTITPALLKGDRLLRRGRVIEPAYSKVS